MTVLCPIQRRALAAIAGKRLNETDVARTALADARG
jgi:hypothetical protein